MPAKGKRKSIDITITSKLLQIDLHKWYSCHDSMSLAAVFIRSHFVFIIINISQLFSFLRYHTTVKTVATLALNSIIADLAVRPLLLSLPFSLYPIPTEQHCEHKFPWISGKCIIYCSLSLSIYMHTCVSMHECVQIVSLIISFISKTGGRWSDEILSCSNFPMKLFKAAHLFVIVFMGTSERTGERERESLRSNERQTTLAIQYWMSGIYRIVELYRNQRQHNGKCTEWRNKWKWVGIIIAILAKLTKRRRAKRNRTYAILYANRLKCYSIPHRMNDMTQMSFSSDQPISTH